MTDKPIKTIERKLSKGTKGGIHVRLEKDVGLTSDDTVTIDFYDGGRFEGKKKEAAK